MDKYTYEDLFGSNSGCSFQQQVLNGLSCICKKLDNMAPESLCDITNLLANIVNNQTIMIAQQGHLPMTMSGNYATINPPVEGYYPDRVTYTTQAIIEIPAPNTPNLVFADMLNPVMYAIFKQPLDSSFPAYFKDGSGYEHQIVDATGIPILSNLLVNNQVYPALYTGNQIILTGVSVVDIKTTRLNSIKDKYYGSK